MAEDSYHARTSQFVMEQDGSAAYLIVDSAHLEQPQMPLVPVLDGYETVAEMEAGLGVPAGSLGKTLARYNGFAARGEDPDFRKSADWLAPAGPGPVGGLRPAARARALRRVHPRRPAHHRGRRRSGARMVRSSRGCTRPGPARPISPRTARGTCRAPSSARGRSSAGGQAGTRPGPPRDTRGPAHWGPDIWAGRTPGAGHTGGNGTRGGAHARAAGQEGPDQRGQ